MKKEPIYYREPGIRFPIYYKNIYSGRLITSEEYLEMTIREPEEINNFSLADKMDILMNTNKER